ncbi:ubiquitin-conjugating enzyme E2-18 kDa-like [Melospiza melodia melodia]|uniref:ubiquitin-conjugating enzyme E2-18 kDa-like n=1 Tax=Melospiza melodia melodia TaxID=1914991 RepID=UPI002FCF342E
MEGSLGTHLRPHLPHPFPQELEEARSWEGARDVRPLDGNVRHWTGLLLPDGTGDGPSEDAAGPGLGTLSGDSPPEGLGLAQGVSMRGTGYQGWTDPPLPRWTLRQRGLRCPPYPGRTTPIHAGAFRFELTFSPNHPHEPPRATLRTPIYHPSVDLEGRVCQPLTSHGHWEPATRAIQVLQDLLLQLDSPDPRRLLRPDVARELQERPEEFLLRAEEHTRLHAEPRP